jgi:hypothetical protein
MTTTRARSRDSRRRLTILTILGMLAVFLLAACSTGASAPLERVGAPVPAAGGAGAGNGGTSGNGNGTGTSGGSTAGGANQPPALNDVNRPDLLVIKTGTLNLQVKAIDDGLAAASAKAAALGGYVAGSQRQGSDEAATATVTLRIPAARWDEALVAMRAIGDKVIGESSQSQDVTGDVLDLGARIRNLQATEQALQAIIAKADKITDVLAVQTELTKTRGEIEQLTTQKQHLEGQAAFSTLTMTFGLKPEAAIVASQKGFDPASEVDRAAGSLVQVLQAVATAGIWFAIVWLPILLVLGIAVGVGLVVVRRFRPTHPLPGAIES